jgi:hypothetical protein
MWVSGGNGRRSGIAISGRAGFTRINLKNAMQVRVLPLPATNIRYTHYIGLRAEDNFVWFRGLPGWLTPTMKTNTKPPLGGNPNTNKVSRLCTDLLTFIKQSISDEVYKSRSAIKVAFKLLVKTLVSSYQLIPVGLNIFNPVDTN